MPSLAPTPTPSDDPVVELREEWCLCAKAPKVLPNLFTRRSWEWAYRNRETNGLQKAIRRLGGKNFIHLRLLRDHLSGASDE